ncbi:hypothetical protein ZIOFF_002852 [Zingiber officinale]|uniref:EamA domain-containing protein n=2 Tax=Zingiber officinale TaxID=94328 RepID=A0A8J5I5S1_ZINOF|nr:hypothetical protein ZIOFF_002852 [Zingiber officinale]
MAIMASMKACAPYICMVVCQFASAGSSILNKLALEQGLSMLVFVVYRHLIAVIILAPLAYVLERNQRPCFSFAIMLKIFILAMVGITIQQNVYYVGLHFTSPTVAVALSNVIPAFTFILAMILRMEKLSLKTARGRTKLGGAIFCIVGALVFIFWKGHLLGVIVRRPLVQFHFKSSKKGDDWVRGSALILTSCFAGSAKLVLQAFICQIYPARLTMNTLVCFFASLQSSALALVFERNASSWRMNWNIQLMAIIYGGTVISCLVYYLQIYCISKKGPVFCSIFAPLAMLIVAFVSAFIFAERLHVGRMRHPQRLVGWGLTVIRKRNIDVSFAYAGSSILGKLALGQGLSALVFVVYRHLIAMLILAPLAYVLERNRRPSFSFGIMLKIFILAMLGITIQQNVYYVGLHLISPTVASALGNVIPAFTFLLAIVLRMEKLSLKTVRGRARLAGTIFCITGALIFTFWKGHLLGAFVTSPLIQLHFESPEKGDAWLKGSALMLFGYFACSVSLVLQASICEIYPAKLTMNAVMCFFAALQSSALSLIFERNASSWRMFWNVQLMTIIYSGTVVSGLVYYMQIYCVSEKGPVFCAIFTPLGMLVVALVSAFVFAEQLHVGSLIGAVIIILGLYCVLWGKSRDSSENGDEDCEAQKDPGAEKNPCDV